MKTLLYVNPKAGQGKPLKYLKGVLNGIDDGNPDFEVILADKIVGLQKLEALASSANRILCLGGDGTVHDVAKICIQNDIALGIIPAGSGDDIAHSIGISTPKTQSGYQDLLKKLMLQEVREEQMTTGLVTFPSGSTHYVLGVMSSGFDAHCNAIANTLRVRGPVRYVLAMLIGLRSFKPVHMQISVDGETSDRSIMMMAIGNGPSYGSGMKVVPHADPFAHSLGAIIVNKCSKPTFLKIFPTVFRGTHVNHELVESLSFNQLRVDIDASQPIFGDGEYFDNGTFEIVACPNSLRVIIP